MSNMSYCRFQNTESDLRDCLAALNDEEYFYLSDDERKAADRIIRMCKGIAEEFGDLVE